MNRIATLAPILNEPTTAQTETSSPFPFTVLLVALLLFAAAVKVLTAILRELAQIALTLARLGAGMLLACVAALFVIILLVGGGLPDRGAEPQRPGEGSVHTTTR